MKKNKQLKKQMMLAGVGICMALGTPVQSAAAVKNAETSEILTSSNAKARAMMFQADEEIWGADVGDMSFLSGKTGNGTKEKPYRISTREQLIGLAALTSMGMEIRDGEGTYPGTYKGAWFELGKNIDLGGMNWIPIGFYRTGADMRAGKVSPFEGHFCGNGHTISNFRLYQPSWDLGGLFGAVEHAEIRDVNVKPGHVITVKENGGIVAGRVKHSEIRNVTAAGTIRTTGNAGGIAADVLEDSVLENCVADHVAIDAGSGKGTFAGGIAGRAGESLISDCEVNTGDSLSARIQGGGYVGGITGFQNASDIFNVHVMGTIGGTGSQAIGGVTGKYASGKMKVARFEGTIASSGLGSAAREGTFIGTHDTGFHFRYGAEDGADIAYLFADTEEKIAAGICGSGVPDDNRFTYDAHIGFWERGDNFYTLVQGQNAKKEKDRYFYEELEHGVLHVIDTEDAVKQGQYTPDHFAPNAVGRPVRGYLLSVLQIDTAANAENFYDVAVLTARGPSAYSKEFHKAYRGAVAAGDTVTVLTAPKNTDKEKFQMDGTPTYTDAAGRKRSMMYQTGGSYQFVMPEHDTEINAVYKKVAAGIRVEPQEFGFRVIEERTGDRRNPSITTEVRDTSGKLLARYLNGKLETGTKVQDVKIQSVVDKNNDVEDKSVRWSVDDDDLILLKKNDDEDASGYTKKSASIELNLNAGFFRDIREKAESDQAAKQYRYPIEDTVYGNGMQGGLAVLTAKTRAVSSFEEKPVTANCRIPVTFQIRDRTKLAADGASFDKTALNFTITRVLTGDRKKPKEMIEVSAPQIITGTFSPDYFDKREIRWTTADESVIQVDAGFIEAGVADGDYKSAKISVKKDTRWMLDLIAADEAAHQRTPNEKRTGSGSRNTEVIMEAKDALGNRQTAVCSVAIHFVTDDRTWSGTTGSSGGRSSGGGNSGRSVKTDQKIQTSAKPAGSVIGEWKKQENGSWKFISGEKMYAGEWAYVYNPYAKDGQEKASWFHFAADGTMQTGWLSEGNDWYYLQKTSDGNQGKMVTGWLKENGKWYFFGPTGRMVKGWNWIDGICYYMDLKNGHMLAGEVTPDGYTVNESGAWCRNGIVQTMGT